jgi:hypothetical protein
MYSPIQLSISARVIAGLLLMAGSPPPSIILKVRPVRVIAYAKKISDEACTMAAQRMVVQRRREMPNSWCMAAMFILNSRWQAAASDPAQQGLNLVRGPPSADLALPRANRRRSGYTEAEIRP